MAQYSDYQSIATTPVFIYGTLKASWRLGVVPSPVERRAFFVRLGREPGCGLGDVICKLENGSRKQTKNRLRARANPLTTYLVSGMNESTWASARRCPTYLGLFGLDPV